MKKLEDIFTRRELGQIEQIARDLGKSPEQTVYDIALLEIESNPKFSVPIRHDLEQNVTRITAGRERKFFACRTPRAKSERCDVVVLKTDSSN